MHYNNPMIRFKKIGLIMTVLTCCLVLTACKAEEKAPRQRPVPEVSAMTMKLEKVMETTELPGRTSAFRVAEIRPQVSGLIQKRLFKEGADVEAGQVLYQIDPAPFQAAIDSAKAALNRSVANLPSVRARAERYRVLLKGKALSHQDYDDAASALAQAKADIAYYKAALETARINLSYTKVKAPISGRIGRSRVTDGAIVTAYQATALATIKQLDPIYVDVPQSTTELLRLRCSLREGRLDPGNGCRDQVELILADGSKYPIKGTYQFQDVTVDPTTGSVILRMVFPNPDGLLLPAMFVRAIVTEGVNDQAVLVPQEAVARNQKGDPYVLTIGPENKVELRMLTLDRAMGDKWLASKGLAAGDRVIVKGLQKVRPGMTVKVASAMKKTASPTEPASQKAETN